MSPSAPAGVRHVTAGHVMALQNGVSKDEQVARYFGAEQTLGAVNWTVYEHRCLGRLPSGTSPSIDAIGAVFNSAGFRTVVSPKDRMVAGLDRALRGS